MTTISHQPFEGYDVIGDVHGHLEPLIGLLRQMGYAEIDGAWRHPTRQAIFVGDLVDRGTHQVELIRLVQAMIAAGSAQMVIGNHEYNAVAWFTRVPGDPIRHCRARDHKNRDQHAEFLAQVGEESPLHAELIEWFCTLPLWLELPLGDSTLRVVHACWDDTSMDVLRPLLSPTGSLTHDAVVETSVKHSPAYEALEVVLKGPEIPLGGAVYVDKGGHPRRKARRRWWDATANTVRAGALIPNDSLTPERQPFPELPDTPIAPLGPVDDVPVIVGHYWCLPPLELWSPTVACVDYSVAGLGPMVAYRWSGESTLTTDHYQAFPVHHPSPEDNDEPGE